jgi:hypothetical protein
MGILLDEIQPCERYLRRTTVDYFLNNPGNLFNREQRIRVFECNGEKFKYYALNGNHRLYVCFKLRKTELPVELDTFKFPKRDLRTHINLAKKAFSHNIRHWIDFEGRIVSDEEYERLTNLD